MDFVTQWFEWFCANNWLVGIYWLGVVSMALHFFTNVYSGDSIVEKFTGLLVLGLWFSLLWPALLLSWVFARTQYRG